jgi:gliding motility-associated-like protein
MITNLPIKKILPFAALLLFSVFSYGQLPDFTLNVTPTPQTCLGNGALAFTVSGTDPAASVDYTVYLLPNTTTPITVVTTPGVTGLAAGNYLIVAIQSLGAEFNTESVNVTIANQVQPLVYTLSPAKVRCGNDGVITVNVTSGNAVSYEILTGPVTVPQQASNVFNNLPVGIYGVRVYDNCGEAVVVTVQVAQDTTNINLMPSNVFGSELPACNLITISSPYALGAGGDNIYWPITYQFTVYPPGGGTPTVLTQNIAGGSLTEVNNVLQNIPFYHGQQYEYDLKVTDACGNVWNQNDVIVNESLEYSVEFNYQGCGDRSFKIKPLNYVGPVTVSFDVEPVPGFNAADYNAAHPTFGGEAEYGAPGNAVPIGNYTVTITDSCGNTFTDTFEVTEPIIEPQIVVEAVCGSDTGSLHIELPGRDIATVNITVAPAEYGPFPDDVTDLLVEGKLDMTLPLGTYVFEMVDECGDTYTEEIEVEVTGGTPNISLLQRPGCEEGIGSIRLNADGDFETVSVTDGPAEFSNSYPVDVSANIAGNGDFYMNSLPEGDYEFTTVDECDFIRVRDVTVTGYEKTINELEVIPYCGSFQIDLQHISNGNYVQAFWLQRYDEASGTWGHPYTGVAYTSALPLNTNSIYININDNSPFYSAVGDFRILKSFYTYSNGATSNSLCTEILHEFTFTGGPVITEVYSFPCADGLTEVAVEVEGVPPFEYKITTKNGEPFLIDNGDSNIFSSLEPAYYNFQVTDACSNILNAQFNINATEPLEIQATGFCEGEESFLAVQPFSFLTYEWYSESDPDSILSTTNSLTFTSFDSDTDSGTYFVRLTAANPASCMNTVLEYEIEPNALPNAGEDNTVVLCNEGDSLNLTDLLTGNDTGGTWEDTDLTGALTGSTFNPSGISAGTYSFRYTVNGLCGLTDDAVVTITLNDVPQPPVVAAVSAVCEGENVQLSLTEEPGVTYQWNGPSGFTATGASPLITGASVAASGTYTVTATSANGCISDAASVTVTVNALPDFSIGGQSALCVGQSTMLSVNPENFNANTAAYAWYRNDELLAGVTGSDIEVFETGIYKVTVNNNGCETTKQLEVVPGSTGFDIVLEQGCIDFEYMLTVANAGEIPDLDYIWTGPNGYYFVGDEAVITNLAPGEYVVTITNAEGCSEIATALVENTSCMIPRGISPNDDEYNQNFDLSNLDVKDIQIFNRYGLQVYEKKNYVNEWYGQSDKGELPAGTYFYVLTLAEGKRMTGWVYLQRQVN